MEMKVLFGGAIMLGGWLWFYLFVRQFLFNFMTAYPLIKQMTAADAELISPNAKRYTSVSVGLCAFVSVVIAVIVVLLCKTYRAVHVYRPPLPEKPEHVRQLLCRVLPLCAGRRAAHRNVQQEAEPDEKASARDEDQHRFHSGIQIKILQGNEITPLHMPYDMWGGVIFCYFIYQAMG